MEDKVLEKVRVALAKEAANRAKMNKTIMKIWAICGPILLVLVAYILYVAYTIAHAKS